MESQKSQNTEGQKRDGSHPTGTAQVAEASVEASGKPTDSKTEEPQPVKPEEAKESTKAPTKLEGEEKEEEKGEEPKNNKNAKKKDEQKDAGTTVEQCFSLLLFLNWIISPSFLPAPLLENASGSLQTKRAEILAKLEAHLGCKVYGFNWIHLWLCAQMFHLYA